jgi:hypothetical protein
MEVQNLPLTGDLHPRRSGSGARCGSRWWNSRPPTSPGQMHRLVVHLCTPTLPGQVRGCGGDPRTPTRLLVLRQAPRKFKGRRLELRARDAPVAV